MTTLPTQQVTTWNPTTEVRQRLRLEADTWVEVKVQNDGSFSGEEIQSLTTWTLRTWLMVVKNLRGEEIRDSKGEIVVLGSVPAHQEPVVAVTGQFIEPSHSLPVVFTFQSNTSPKQAFESTQSVLAATGAAITALETLSGLKQQPAPSPAPAPGTAPQPRTSAGGAVFANRAPNPKTPAYQNGQTVIFKINKVVKGTNKGSVTYALWGPLGQRFPLHTIYVTGKTGEDSLDWQAVGDKLKALGLSVDEEKIEASVNWHFETVVAHTEIDGQTREFFNAVSIKEA